MAGLNHPLDFLAARRGAVIPTVWDVLSASAARDAGAEAVLLSGSALAGTIGLPDLGLVGPDAIVSVSEAIVRSVGVPLLVDIDDGHGSPVRLGRLIEQLGRVGVSAVMIEDATFPGSGVLCDPDEMVARIEIIKSASGSMVKVLARTDVLGPTWPFSDTMSRLSRYLEGGADWVIPAFIRTVEEHWAVAEFAAPRAFSMPEVGGIPSVADSISAGYRASVVSAHLAVHSLLVGNYLKTLRGDTAEVFALDDPWRSRLQNSKVYEGWLRISEERRREDHFEKPDLRTSS